MIVCIPQLRHALGISWLFSYINFSVIFLCNFKNWISQFCNRSLIFGQRT